MTDWTAEFKTPRFVIALAAMLIFAWAYGQNVDDKTMVGAIIGGFNLALGFYLGSSRGAQTAQDNVGKALDVATQNGPPVPPTTILQPGEAAVAAPSTAEN